MSKFATSIDLFLALELGQSFKIYIFSPAFYSPYDFCVLSIYTLSPTINISRNWGSPESSMTNLSYTVWF